MYDFNAKMHHICSDPAVGSDSVPQTLTVVKGLLLKGGRNGGKGKAKER